MEKNNNLVTLKVTSDEGHTEFTLTPNSAIDKINEIYNTGGKWLYLDGTVIEPSRVTESMLIEAKSILMNNIVVGGNCCDEGLAAIMDLHISEFVNDEGDSVVEGMDEKSTFPITVEIVWPDKDKLQTEPRIRYWVDERYFAQVMHLRELLFKGGLRKLNEFGQNELNKFRNTYNV